MTAEPPEPRWRRWARPALAIYWLALATGTHLPRLKLHTGSGEDGGGLHLDKLVHAAAFAVLTVLIWAALAARRRVNDSTKTSAGFKVCLLAAAIAAIYAPLDEYTQGWLPERTRSWADLFANWVGVAIALPVTAFLAHQTTSPKAGRLQSARTTDELSPNPTQDHASESESPEDHNEPQFVKHAVTISLLTVVSRITGLVRDAVLAAAFGLSSVADAFFIGFLLPNLFRRLFGEGALTAAFVPAYTRLLRADQLNARRLASLSVAVFAVALTIVTLVGEAILIALLSNIDWSPDTHLALRLSIVLLPYMPLVCLVALFGGMLHVHGRFGPPAAAPILLNLFIIAAALLGSRAVFGDGTPHETVFVVGFGILVAGVAQLAWQVLAVLRVERLTTELRAAWPAFRAMIVVMIPMVIGLAAFQINVFLDSVIAFALSPKEGGPDMLTLFGHQVAHPIQTGGVAALQWAQRLYQFPLGVFGIAIATAIFPALARAGSGDDVALSRKRLGDTLRNGLRLTVFIGLPASVGLILVRIPLARVIYERGRFDTDDAMRVAWILIGYASVVWAYSMTHVLTRAFYAVNDARTPLKISLVMVVLNFSLNCVLVWPMGAAGLAWSSAVSATGQVVFLLYAFRKHSDDVLDGDVWRSWGKTALLSAVMAGAILPMLFVFDVAEGTWTNALVQLCVMVGLGIVVFAIGARVLRAPELHWLLKRRIT